MKAIKNLRRAASLMLALVLLLTMFPVQGTAEEIATPSDLSTAEETVQEEPVETTDVPDAELLPDSTAPPEETTETSGEPPAADTAEETPPAEDTAEDTPTDPVGDTETAPSDDSNVPPAESDPDVDQPADEATNVPPAEEQDTAEQPISLKDAIAANGFAYIPNLRNTKVYNSPDLTEDAHIFTLTRMELVLLATDYLDNGSVEVWFLVSADAAMHGYVSAKDLAEHAPTVAELDDLTYLVFCKDFTTSVGVKPLYLVYGDFVEVEEPTHGETEPDVPADENAETQAPAENPSEEQPSDENPTPEDAEATEPVTDVDAAEELPDDYIDPSELPEPDPVEVGSYVTVTTQTRVFSDVDETAGYDYIGDLYQGYFVKEATVRVEAAGEDCCGRWWYEVTYLYGDTYANGKLKWTATDRAIVLARETTPTDSTELTVTDYAFPRTGIMMMSMAEAPSGFTLKRISGPTGSFYVGQDNLHGSSGRDAEYKQIATLEGHGKIYATPHFLEGYVVYCLEHTLPGPGENISGGGKQPTGPYLIVDWESYQITDGYSGAIYGEDTMHGIAWVLAHGYPFMVLDRSDSDNETWSRVATQFAIREVIKQMEGAQYVRDYWQMDNFYAASNNAPAVYLEYARWLARNGIAHARRTGEITVSNKTFGAADGGYYGTVTLDTDADMMRVSKEYGSMTGNTAGDDDHYYYINPGDTVTLYSSSNTFSMTVESMSEDEADFLVGVPDAAIQKVLIPIEGDPYPMKELTIDFEMSLGSIVIHKESSTGEKLSGATFMLMDSQGTPLQTSTTAADGTATFANLPAGDYLVQEIEAPSGYAIAVPAIQRITVTTGSTLNASFVNEPIRGMAKIIKTDAVTGERLMGAEFTVTDAHGQTVTIITTGVSGTAETSWLPMGTYTITETAAPSGYLNSGFSETFSITTNGDVFTFEVQNIHQEGGIRLTKTDAVSGLPIADVVFDIYQGSAHIGSMTTDTSGVAVYAQLVPGSYTVKERALPAGYAGALVEVTAEVQASSTTELAVTNVPAFGQIRIIKTDAATGAALAGATFEISNINGLVLATLNTDSNGVAESALLPYGLYLVTETAAPSGYLNEGFSTVVEVKEDGKTYTVDVSNEPMRGGIRLTKTDALTGKPIAGVTFDIYLGNALVGSMQTNANGVAVSGDLEPGSYTVRERSLPTGYAGELVSLTALVEANTTAELTATNTPSLSRVKIVKKDTTTGALLAGATFTVTNASDVTVATITTGADGTAVTDWLPYGTYTVTETSAPDHYINEGFSQTFDAHEDGKTYTFEVTNTAIQGGIRLTKTDAVTGKPIAGVTFDIYQGSTLVSSTTTNSAGIAVSEALEPGSYTVKERALPNGYTGDLISLDALVQSELTTELTCTNMPIQGKAKIVKTNALTSAPLAGATFTITDASGKTVATLTTAADGTAETGWLLFGSYTITETAAPENYINAGFSQTFDVSEDGKTYTFEVANIPMQGGIKLVKTDAISGKPIAGVTFDIYQGSTLVGSMTTNDSGVAVSEALDPGTYTVRERELPVGYVGELVELEVVVESQVTAEVTATNIPSHSKVKIIKTDSLTETLLPGATFTITDESGALAATLTTGADGTATSDWLPYGTYIISETAAPDHYVNSGFCQTVYAHENGKTYEFAVENAPTKGSIRLTKTDALDGRPIAGVTFDIYLGEQMVASMTTNESGVAVAPDLEKGIYTIREVALPEGYTGDLVELTAEVQSDHTTELSCTNTPLQGKVRIEKKDSLTGEVLAGATFTISDVDGSVVETLITDADGSAESGLLRYGEYTITETAAPEHYVNSGFTETFFVSEDGKTYTFQVENAPTLGGIRLTKTDALDGRPLSGVVFDIYQGETLIGSMTTDEQGVASYTALNPGSYTARERSLPTGYTGVLVEVTADVQSDETTELTAVNHPIQGRVKVIKVDSLTGAPLSGAIFTLTDANGQTIATLTTGVNGVAESELLRYGIYTLTETAAPENYLNGDFSETFAITEEGVTITYEVENTPVQGWIRLSKTDTLSGKPIAGVTFDMYQGDTLITSMTTNAEGIAESVPLYPGTYTVKEHALPTGYAGELVVLDAVVTSANTAELTCTNMPSQSKIRIVKTDSLTHAPLSGAEFTVTDAAGTVVAVLTTGADGTVETDWLRYGVYTVKETLTPAHYIPSSCMTTIEAFDDGKTYVLDVENEPTKGFVEIVKIDELTRTPIAGVQFDIYQGDTLVSTMTTNANGAARSEALHKGQYTVREHENPTGYVGVLSEMDATVRSDETTYLTATNMPIQGRIQIIKTDALTGEKLAGAEFTITRISGIPAHNGAGDGEVVATITTDAEGMAITPLLTWGTYRVEESTVPMHYVDNAFSVDVTITNDLETVTVDVTNEPTKGWIKLTKSDCVNGNPIPGVQFDVYYNDPYGEGLACTMTTDENGVALSEPLRKGQYIVREHGALDGYVYEEIRLDATVKSDETTELAATNQPVLTRIKLYKRDVDEYDGKNPNSKADTKASAKLPKEVTIEATETRGDGVLIGTVLRVSAGEDIVDRQGNIIYRQGMVIIESLTTAGEDASVETDLLWPGLYEVQEIAAPTGYQIDPEPFYVDTRSAAYQSDMAVILYNGLSLNEIKYGAISIVKILGANGADPDPTRVETPEKDAKFRVYLKSAGSYEKARKIERDILTTDAHGYAMTKPLPYGVYVLEQTAGKEGYEIKGPIEFEITGEESLVNPPPITLSDQPILYRLKLIKTDAKTGKVITLANTSFKLKDSEGNYVTQTSYYPTQQTLDTFTTDESGTVTLPETVTWGLYHIEEVHAPEGYLIRTESLAVMIGHSGDEPGQTYELDIAIPNEPVMGRIKLEKRGMQLVGFQQAAAGGYNINIPIYDDRYLADAVFEIRAAEDIVGQEGTVWYKADQLVQTITTTDTGSDMSMELPLGRYYLLEVKTPEGYILADTPYEVELAYVDDTTPLVEVNVQASNDYLPAEVLLTKEKEVMQTSNVGDGIVHQVIATAPGEGCVFGIYNAKDIRYPAGTLMVDSLISTGVTDENGQMTFSGVYPHGDYYIKELSAPDGWKINPTSYPISITHSMTAEDAEIIRIALNEPICNEIVHTPVTLTKTDITGAHTVPGALIEVEDNSGSIIYRAYTDENGEIPDIPVIPGDYIFREVLAPEGYALNTAEMAFSVDAAGNVTGSTTIRDDYTRVMLKKVDLNGEPLEGVGFGLYRSGKLLATSYSDADGVVTFTQIPYGDYIIRETRPLSGYMLSDVQVHLTVDGTFVNPTAPLATVENNPIEVILRKVDKDNKPLSGAVFALVDDTGAQVMTALSDETGTVKFTYVPYGSYTIQEIEAPTGYLLSRESIPVVIDKNYRNSTEPLATLVNQAKRLSYIKIDTSRKPLPGVVFDLVRADTGEIVESVTSNEWGEFIFTRFDYGEWIIREVAAPEGFNRMEDLYLVVDVGWVEPEPIFLVNIPNHYEFVKTDHGGNPMAGVKFTLEDAQGNILRDLVSGEDGIVHVTDLAPGSYTIREIETLEGFTRTEETIQVTISEQYIVPDEMFRLVNYPIIQTGAGIEMGPLMWIGAGLAGCSVLMLLLYWYLRRKYRLR